MNIPEKYRLANDGAIYKHACVVSAENTFIDFVRVHLVENKESGENEEVVQGYSLRDGEYLVDANRPIVRSCAGAEGFICPVWGSDAAGWVEAATAEEIAAWEAEHPAPVPTEEEVRAKRDRLLAATDWTQVLDAPISAESKEEYRVYRQALRDVPQQEGFPASVEWPELPGKEKAAPDPVDEAVEVILSGATEEVEA